MSERDALGDVKALAVRPAVGQRPCHPGDGLPFRGQPKSDDSADPAHVAMIACCYGRAVTAYRLPTSAELTRPRPLRLLSAPWRERRFTYRSYDSLLARLAEPGRFRIVPLRGFRSAPDDLPVVALRHDVDDRLGSAVRFAELEHARGVRSTYFVLHTAPYYGRGGPGMPGHDPALLPVLLRLQNDLGHEIGFHHDLVTLQRVHETEPGGYLAREIAWLRGAGVDIRGCAAHGSYWAHRHGYHNNYAFEGWDEPQPGHPRTDLSWKLDPADYGLEYDAGHLDETHYFTDSRLDGSGRRWHPDVLDLDALAPSDRMILLLHSCHWDTSIGTKALRTYRRGIARLAGRRRR